MSSRKAPGADPESGTREEPTPLPLEKPSITLVRDRAQKARSAGGEENRVHPRLPLVIRAELDIDGAEQVGYLTNLSLGGAFLATEKVLPVETAIHLHVFLPWKLGDFETEARVVWSSGRGGPESGPPGVGIKFTGLDSHADRLLRAYVDAFFRLVGEIGK